MIRQRYYLRKMANKTGSPYLRQAFQQIRNKITYSIRKARADDCSKSIEENKGDLRKTWKILKQNSLKMKNQTVINQINLGGKVITEKQEICDILILMQFKDTSESGSQIIGQAENWKG